MSRCDAATQQNKSALDSMSEQHGLGGLDVFLFSLDNSVSISLVAKCMAINFRTTYYLKV
jgi:hypothetical protein